MSEPLDPQRRTGFTNQSPSQNPKSESSEGAGINRRISDSTSEPLFQYQAKHLQDSAPSIKKRDVSAKPRFLAKTTRLFLGGVKQVLWDTPIKVIKKLPGAAGYGLGMVFSAERNTGGVGRRTLLKAAGAYIYMKGESLVKNVTTQAGIELRHHNQETQKNLETLLKNFLQNYALDKVIPAGKRFDFPEIIKKRKGEKEISIQNLKFELEPIKAPPSGILTSHGSLSNQFKIKNLSCHLDIPFEGFEKPMRIAIGIKDAQLSVSTGLSLSRAAWELKQGRKSTYHDATALQLTAEKVNVQYDALATCEELPHSSKEDKKYLYAFNNGMVTFKDLKFSVPTNLFKKDLCQNSYLSFRELHHTSFPDDDFPSLIEVPEVAVCNSDNKNNGVLTAKAILTPQKLKGFKVTIPIIKRTISLGAIIAYLCPSPLTLNISCPMAKGEVRFSDLKQSITLTGPWSARKLIGWLLYHPETKLLGTEEKPKIQIRGHKWLTFKLPPLIGFQPARATSECQGEASRSEGYFVVPSYLSKFCSRCVGTVKGSHFPLTVISGELEEIAEKAAKGDKTAGKQLFQAAISHDQTGHKYEARAALLALPASQLLELSKTMTEDDDWQWMMEQTQALHYHDQKKATELFAELLKQKNIHEEAPVIEKPEVLLTLAESLLKQIPQKTEVIMQVLEFAYLRDPEKNSKALSLLVELHNKGHYSKEKLSKFISQQLSDNTYFKSPDQRVKLLDLMVRYMPEIVKADLTHFPLDDLAAQLTEQKMSATVTLGLLVNLIRDAGAYGSGAEILIQLDKLDSAIDLLNEGVQKNHPEAISKRAELVARYRGLPGHTVAGEIHHLIRYLENPESTPAIVEASAMSLGTLLKGEDNHLALIFTHDLQSTAENEDTQEIVSQLRDILLNADGLNFDETNNPLMLQNYFIRQLAQPLQQLKKVIVDKKLSKENTSRLINRTEAALRVAQYLNDYLNPMTAGLGALNIELPANIPVLMQNPTRNPRRPEQPQQVQSAPIRTQSAIPVIASDSQPTNPIEASSNEFCNQLLATTESAPELERAMSRQGLAYQRRALLTQMNR